MKVPLPNESKATKFQAFLFMLSKSDKRNRRIAEKRISNTLFGTEISADMSAD